MPSARAPVDLSGARDAGGNSGGLAQYASIRNPLSRKESAARLPFACRWLLIAALALLGAPAPAGSAPAAPRAAAAPPPPSAAVQALLGR